MHAHLLFLSRVMQPPESTLFPYTTLFRSIDGEITLGMMMAISYIIGKLNNPIQQLIGLVYSVQDAKIALERLSEIHNREDETSAHRQAQGPNSEMNDIPENPSFDLQGVHFRYTGSSEEVLKGINMKIPANKVTAIVG